MYHEFNCELVKKIWQTFDAVVSKKATTSQQNRLSQSGGTHVSMRKELVSGSNNDVIMHQFHTAKVKTTQVMIGAGLKINPMIEWTM